MSLNNVVIQNCKIMRPKTSENNFSKKRPESIMLNDHVYKKLLEDQES